jgi:DNA-3-methyladenine glycosylase
MVTRARSARSPAPRVLPAGFYARLTLAVAQDLIGKVLVHDAPDGSASGIIVEAEAYIGESDPACHAAPGPTSRNAPLYGAPGRAYVYFNYGMHWLVNAVTEPEGAPAAVLIRGLEPLEGIESMRARRLAWQRRRREGPARAGLSREIPIAQLCRGPGNLTRALAIGAAENRLDLAASRLRIEDRGFRYPVAWSARVGIRVGLEHDWRVYVPGHPAVSWRR